MPHYVASDLSLHCLPMTLLRVSRQEWVKTAFTNDSDIWGCLSYNQININAMPRQSYNAPTRIKNYNSMMFSNPEQRNCYGVKESIRKPCKAFTTFNPSPTKSIPCKYLIQNFSVDKITLSFG